MNSKKNYCVLLFGRGKAVQENAIGCDLNWEIISCEQDNLRNETKSIIKRYGEENIVKVEVLEFSTCQNFSDLMEEIVVEEEEVRRKNAEKFELDLFKKLREKYKSVDC